MGWTPGFQREVQRFQAKRSLTSLPSSWMTDAENAVLETPSTTLIDVERKLTERLKRSM